MPARDNHPSRCLLSTESQDRNNILSGHVKLNSQRNNCRNIQVDSSTFHSKSRSSRTVSALCSVLCSTREATVSVLCSVLCSAAIIGQYLYCVVCYGAVRRGRYLYCVVCYGAVGREQYLYCVVCYAAVAQHLVFCGRLDYIFSVLCGSWAATSVLRQVGLYL